MTDNSPLGKLIYYSSQDSERSDGLGSSVMVMVHATEMMLIRILQVLPCIFKTKVQ